MTPTVGMKVTTHPVDKRERSRRGVVVKLLGPLSKVDVGDVKPLTFWNFELEPTPERLV